MKKWTQFKSESSIIPYKFHWFIQQLELPFPLCHCFCLGVIAGFCPIYWTYNWLQKRDRSPEKPQPGRVMLVWVALEARHRGWHRGVLVCNAWRAHHERQTLILACHCERGWTLHDLLCNLWILITTTIYQDIYHTISFAAVEKQYWCFQCSFIIDSKKPKTKLKNKTQPYAYLT